jgi:hypothetical protein
MSKALLTRTGVINCSVGLTSGQMGEGEERKQTTYKARDASKAKSLVHGI